MTRAIFFSDTFARPAHQSAFADSRTCLLGTCTSHRRCSAVSIPSPLGPPNFACGQGTLPYNVLKSLSTLQHCVCSCVYKRACVWARMWLGSARLRMLTARVSPTRLAGTCTPLPRMVCEFYGSGATSSSLSLHGSTISFGHRSRALFISWVECTSSDNNNTMKCTACKASKLLSCTSCHATRTSLRYAKAIFKATQIICLRNEF